MIYYVNTGNLNWWHFFQPFLSLSCKWTFTLANVQCWCLTRNHKLNVYKLPKISSQITEYTILNVSFKGKWYFTTKASLQTEVLIKFVAIRMSIKKFPLLTVMSSNLAIFHGEKLRFIVLNFSQPIKYSSVPMVLLFNMIPST